MAQRTAAPTGEVTIARTFDVPREAVWRAWTEPEAFASWFSTPPFSTPTSTVSLDVRPGGEWRATQVSEADGTELPFMGHYREVVEPARLVLTFENPEDPDDPDVEVATVTFTEIDGTTEMVLHQTGTLPPEQYELLKDGYSRFFDRMEEYLRSG